MKIIPKWWREMTGNERCGVIASAAILLAIFGKPAIKISGIPICYASGERTGVVVKLSKKGIIWKTWEGQMNVGSMSTDGNGLAVPAAWECSVTDESVVKQIQDAAKSGNRITLRYDQPLVMSWVRGSSGYLVTVAER